MTLKEMKVKTFSLIEEYYPDLKELAEDEDVLNKINGVVNQIQMDLMKYRKINATKDITVEKTDDKKLNLFNIINDCYQVNKIVFHEEDIEYDMPDDITLVLPEDFSGTFTVYYYKYPKMVKVLFENEDERTSEDETFKFELDPVLLEIMPWGIAANLLLMDMISGYGRYFYEKYLEMKNSIDSRRTSGQIVIEGGANV